MDPQPTFCPNLDCPASGQSGQGNITSHGRKRPRYRCTVCQTTFGARRGTPFYRRRTPEAVMTQVLTLVAHGCPIPAIEVAFRLQTRTVQDWITAAGQHAQGIQQTLVEQPHDLQQVQADEIRVKTQTGVVWLAMALMADYWPMADLNPSTPRSKSSSPASGSRSPRSSSRRRSNGSTGTRAWSATTSWTRSPGSKRNRAPI